MRTLLIDNYDSYTYNLFQLIGVVSGAPPEVLTNAAAFTPDDLDGFDNVVISPGPGHPAEPGDFGISALVVDHARIPVLGVCLGHQGIATGEGGQVVPAPRARHGHLTRVRHDGDALFQGVPTEFTAVRYHSLCVREPLPPTLRATAWAEDGVVMALRHVTRPLWGVQFHPESVATEYGAELMTNFMRLTTTEATAHRAGRERIEVAAPATPTAARPRPGTRERTSGPARFELLVRTVDHPADTEELFTRLYAGAPEAFWLDSALVAPGLARFSFLGAGAAGDAGDAGGAGRDAGSPRAETVTYRVGDGSVRVRTADGVRRVPGTIFDYLRHELAARSIDAPPLPFDFTCGYVGWFGYELKADCGSAAVHRADSPDAVLMFADRLVAVDHEQGRVYLLALRERTGSDGDAARAWLDRTAAAVRATRRAVPHRSAGPVPVLSDVVEHLLVRDRDQYLSDIAACQEQLLAGQSYEICLTNAVRLPATADGYTFYRRLRRVNPAPYAAYLTVDGVTVACSSPERFLRVDGERTVESKPIKGTQRRGRTEAEDVLLRDELASSAKTRGENLMIVDLLRNDLGRVCEVGSVHVPRLMVTETYETVHQLVSTVRGRLRPDASVVDCVQACFPGGSMTGAPKLRTMEIIDSLETEARGVYSGAIGYLGLNGTADLNIVIRTGVLIDGEWRVGAGGAIVLDSDPADEYDEMLLKALAPLRAHDALVAGGADGRYHGTDQLARQGAGQGAAAPGGRRRDG